jgi:hypothetical protein
LGGQFMPPTMPFMPPMPPTASVSPMPPAPADYTQQLFSYLQAWRQYLEQMTGAGPGSPQASTTQGPTAPPANAVENPSANDSGTARPGRPADVPIPPGDDTGSRRLPGSDAGEGSNPTWPPYVALAPSSYLGTEAPAPSRFRLASLFSPKNQEGQVLLRPDYDYETFDNTFRLRPDLAAVISSAGPGASRSTSEAPAQRPVGSPFLSAMGRLGPTAAPQVAPRSLFSTPGAQTPSARFKETGETPSP